MIIPNAGFESRRDGVHPAARDRGGASRPRRLPLGPRATVDSLEPFVLEETYELIDAIDRQDHHGVCEELGDFVFEAVFLAQLESENGHFSMADSLKSVADKLVRRHPHVFARSAAESQLHS